MTKLALLLTAALAATGCRDRADTNDRTGYSKSAQTADEDFEHTRSTYSTKLNERLRQLDDKIHELAARGTETAREAADELRVERDRLAPKLDEVGRQAKDGWDRFESEVSAGFDRLQQRVDDALDRD